MYRCTAVMTKAKGTGKILRSRIMTLATWITTKKSGEDHVSVISGDVWYF